MGYIDLHVHSTVSDGTLSPEDLVAYACEKGLSAFALTDHDSVDGVDRAIRASHYYPVRVIPGVEISTMYKDKLDLHILGLNIDYYNPRLVRTLEVLKVRREDRNDKMCNLLQKQGIRISMDMLHDRLDSQAITRSDMANIIVEQGFARTKGEAFEKYIGKNSLCFVPRYKLSVEEAAKLIKDAGGVCVLAHPIQYNCTADEYRDLFADVQDMGVDGIEAIYSTHSFDDELMFKELAERMDMFITGGSDFHGANKPDIDLGTGKGNLMIPDTLLAKMGI
ncbi:MAG: PHP domain-containing protein [Parasporobacterium sp.]|nr:PHP domain-containing protein [Parasporobacterium sp.]